MSYELTTNFTGEIGVNPRLVRLASTDSLATITTAGYLSNSSLYPTDIIFCSYANNATVMLKPSISSSNVVTLSSTETIPASTSSATPGTLRALTGAMTSTATTMTSGNLVGVRGSVNMVGASGGFVYGAQGKVIPTGTISGSVWVAGVFGQFDNSAATVTTGQMAALWGDYGTTMTSGTYTGCRGIAMTNTTAAILNSQIYLYGGATNLLELATNTGGVGATYVATPAGSTPGGALRTLTINIDGTSYKILAAATYS